VAANTDASVALTFTTRDQASPGIQRIGGNLTRLQSTAAGVGKVFANNATAFLTAGLALSSIGGQASSLLVKFGVLNERQGDFVNTGFQITAVVLGGVTAFSSLALALNLSRLGIGGLAAGFIGLLPLIIAVAGAAAATGIAIAAIFKEITEGPGASAELISGILQKAGVPEGAAEFIGGGAGESARREFERTRLGISGGGAKYCKSKLCSLFWEG